MARGGRRAGAGRPKGAVNKQPSEVKELARSYTADAIYVLYKIAMNGESEAARVSAANAILDRGHGKPSQSLTGEDGTPLFPSEVVWRRASAAD